ncbi:MAG: zf-HC2 domain-containing protein [Gemmatimonadota bacterium]|nr:zf-HC2 domain-containing protein [Gemmatimonadota bacterium]
MTFEELISRIFARWRPRRAPASMLDCESVMRQLWDYLDDELTPERMLMIGAHLAICARCHPKAEFERAFLRAVATSGRAHTDPGRVRAHVMDALRTAGYAGL